MPGNSDFTRAERNLLALPIPSLAVGFLARNDTDEVYQQRSELIGYSGPLQIVETRNIKNLRRLLVMLGAIEETQS